MGGLSFEPLIPTSLWLALALVAAALLAWYAARRPGMIPRARWVAMIGLMACGLLLVLGILLNPTWVREVAPPPGKPLLTLLVDSSASMSTPDADRGVTRYSAAALQAMELADALKKQFDVRVRTFASAASAAGVEDLPVRTPAGESTDLATSILASLDEQRPQGQAVVLLSDGIHNTAGGASSVLNATRLAKAGATPIYTRTFGGQASGFDVALELRSSQDLAIINQKVPITARLSHHGMGAGKANVLLMQDGKEVARRDAQLMPGSPADVHFVVGQDKVGVYSYEVRVEPQTGEKTQVNNTASYVLRVVDEPIRVLVLEGKPYWDSKFFLRTLGADPAVALDSVVKLTDSRFMRRTLSNKEKTAGTDKKQPDRLETWKIVNDGSSILDDYNAIKPYQVVVLGRDAEAFLTDTAIGNLGNWVSRDGGSLVCYRGAPAAQVNQRLAKLLPVRWAPANESRFRVQLTDQGRDMQWLGAEATVGTAMLATMPPLATRTKIEQPKPLAVVLATSSDSTGAAAPTVVYQPYGAGRVVVIEGSGMWRWAFLPPQFQDHEQVYAGIWPSLLRWLTSGSGLAPGQQMTLRADKVRFATSEMATATLLARKEVARGELPNIELIVDVAKGAPAGAPPKTFAPAAMGGEVGVFSANFGKLPAGRYQIRIAGAQDDDASARAVFDVRAFGEEELNLEARPDLMARIAADSDGAVISASSADEIRAKFKEHFTRTRPPRVERSSAWDRWWVLLGVVGLWGLSWTVRRSGGLV